MRFSTTLFCRFVLLGLAAAGLSANASPVNFSVNSGNLTASAIVQGGSIVGMDVRGAVILGVNVSGSAVNDIGLLDSTGGTDPGATTLAFGNSSLGSFGAGGLGGGPYATVAFDLLTPSFLSGGAVMLLGATAAPFAGNVAGDGGLNALVTGNPLLFGFGFARTQDLGAVGTLYQYNLLAVQATSAGAPEPATVFSLLGGAMILGILNLRKRRVKA